MFATLDEAHAALAKTLPADLTDRVAAALVPAIILMSAANDTPATARLGGTRLGGTPDLPDGLTWPSPDPPADPEAIAKRGNADAGAEMRAHFALHPPLAFFAQIDLSDAAALGPVASALPAEGRLLFFYDYAVGPWEPGSRTTRVIWDRAPRDRLKPSATPPDLAEAIAREHEAEKKAFAEHGLDMPERSGSVYAAPGRPARLEQVLRLPNPHSLEIARLPEIAALAAKPFHDRSETESKLYDAYREAIEDLDSFDHDRSRRQQLLGSPMPEQDDPRYEAVVVTQYGKPHLSRDEWKSQGDAVSAAAHAWRLLLQIDLADWTQADYAEGTVYFLIRTDELAKRAFEGVVGIYQQT